MEPDRLAHRHIPITQPGASYAAVDRITASLSVEQKAAQLLMVGLPSGEIDPDTETMVRNLGVGGVILYRRNVRGARELAALTSQLQDMACRSKAGIGLFVAIDQEGGTAVQLWESEVATPPGAMAIGAAGSEELAHRVAHASGTDLRALGINMNLAPVLDVNSDVLNPVIGVRSFGADPHLVARLGAAAIRGFRDAGILCCGKHFPGHGDTRDDSHLDLPVVPHDRRRLERVDLVPFKHAVAAGADAIMTAHVAFPGIEPDATVPATLSHVAVSGLLKGELRFPGVAMSDLMSMKAIADRYDTGEAAVRAVAAGIDLLLAADDRDLQRTTLGALVSAARAGSLSSARLDDAVRRVLRAKLRVGLLPASRGALSRHLGVAGAYREPLEPAQSPRSVAHEQFFANVFRSAITVVRDRRKLLPFRLSDECLLGIVFIAHENELQGERWQRAREKLLQAFSRRHGRCTEVREATGSDMGTRADAFIAAFCTRKDLNPGEVEMARSLTCSGKPVIGLGLFNPFIIRHIPEMDCFVAAYDYCTPAIEAAVEAIFGESEPKGTLPVETAVERR